jgi:heme exporter protein D
MLAEQDPQKKSALKNPFLYSWAALAVAALVVGLILLSRWQENRILEKRAKAERTQKQQEQDRVTLEQMGGKELAIQTFYASPGTIRSGETVQLCYGVANAKLSSSSHSPIRSGLLTPAALM